MKICIAKRAFFSDNKEIYRFNSKKEYTMNKIEEKFTSGNSIPVESIRITRKEYDDAINSVVEEQKEKDVRIVWNDNDIGLTFRKQISRKIREQK